jgi:hypothetical protein
MRGQGGGIRVVAAAGAEESAVGLCSRQRQQRGAHCCRPASTSPKEGSPTVDGSAGWLRCLGLVRVRGETRVSPLVWWFGSNAAGPVLAHAVDPTSCQIDRTQGARSRDRSRPVLHACCMHALSSRHDACATASSRSRPRGGDRRVAPPAWCVVARHRSTQRQDARRRADDHAHTGL